MDLKPFHSLARCLNSANDAFHFSYVWKRPSGHFYLQENRNIGSYP
jgi:hypothetical protein